MVTVLRLNTSNFWMREHKGRCVCLFRVMRGTSFAAKTLGRFY